MLLQSVICILLAKRLKSEKLFSMTQQRKEWKSRHFSENKLK